jgi:hypothetical protein
MNGLLLWPLLQAALLNLHVNLKVLLFIRCFATNSAAQAASQLHRNAKHFDVTKGKGQSHYCVTSLRSNDGFAAMAHKNAKHL